MEENQNKKEQLKVINGYLFENNQEYLKAQKEKQIVDQMKKTMDWKNPEIAYKLYRKVLDTNSFTTIIGIHSLGASYCNFALWHEGGCGTAFCTNQRNGIVRSGFRG